MAYDTQVRAKAPTDEELFMQDMQNGSPWGVYEPTDADMEAMYQEDLAYRAAHNVPAA